jgi:hypothetical protein
MTYVGDGVRLCRADLVAGMGNGIKALTIEVCYGCLLSSTTYLTTMIQIGNPSTFQHDLIMRTVDGICNTLTVRLGYPLLSDHYAIQVQQQSPVICCRSVSAKVLSAECALF